MVCQPIPVINTHPCVHTFAPPPCSWGLAAVAPILGGVAGLSEESAREGEGGSDGGVVRARFAPDGLVLPYGAASLTVEPMRVSGRRVFFTV